MKRGDVVTVAMQGDFGKPRPAVVIQTDALLGTRHVIVCPLTSSRVDLPAVRYPVKSTAENGLRIDSQVMLNNVATVSRAKCGPVVGALTAEQMLAINERLAFVLGLGG
ncbi:MAG: type II toxin-antitoxin system PemK/MazF family toxin [Bosea sp. (in: a-proteobacteria)]|uniref:type II toxin-antitoxin system PemK/MazF family toxin n=1 Tax=Bosea sp. (in: a-proteobacteria) TaxID=1871050 RepID=UPI0027349F3F|nr:type II toxin-antitoxin system PemK/MazF family toxin [Bosea sp. (in: a-proteobacteria)]MDP3258096.1 type II toxin-antitoxin system PemK/MazF family toxin [Bosea sp. (in: a-proteobacteria)]MDP3317927.1 type II toxin-antitoxin system PemK/MazF family toxin [Bosea sp. (in: a-proteobacteria)]